MKLPKMGMANINVRVPKIAVPKIGMVRAPKIGYPRQTMSGVIKTKIKLK